ncbi:MAG: tyrosine-type recombinase/integrase [Candidatus Bipolaricaulota bacterium]|nr:tyrosine-type recombinase/integrase [Candidatus Bipolaricaulota bacterium]
MAQRKREWRKVPDVLTAEEQVALLKQPNPRYPTGERNQLILRVMLNAGLRLAETTALSWKDIDLNTGRLEVQRGKGARDRVLWIGDADLEALREWRERQARDVEGTPGHVFTTLEGKPVSSRYVQAMVKRYAQKAGIGKNVHTFATDIYRETSSIRLTQKALGHADLSTTQIYTHIVDEELEGALKSFATRRSQRSATAEAEREDDE